MHTAVKFKRKRYNLNLNLTEVPEKRKKSTKKSKNEISLETQNSSAHTEEGEINPADEFEAEEGLKYEKSDPFMQHLKDDLSPALHSALSQKPPKLCKDIVQWPYLGKLVYFRAHLDETKENTNNKGLLSEPLPLVTTRPLPEIPTNLNYDSLHIKSQILPNINNILSNDDGSKCITPIQRELLELISNYHDLYYPEVNMENNEEIRKIYCIHVINHIVKTRLKIVHHNAKLKECLDVPDEFRDQGLVRPKVLILVPFRSLALRIVQTLISILLGEKGTIMNKKRFLDEYSGDTLIMPERNPKPIDYQQLFSGNTDDNFKIGLTVTKKCLKLYADFYASDIIVASPLGLRVLIGTEGEEQRDYDFLSSIELLIMDQTQVFVMQNWEHVIHLMDHLHLQPKNSHDNDLSRARTWALNGWSKYYMQALVFSSHPMPEISSLFNGRLLNYGGKIIVMNPVVSGSLAQVIVHVPQMFHYISCSSLTDSIDARFQAFTSNFLPMFKDAQMKHVLVYIPSYFDFVRIRNYCKRQELHFVQICEYSQEKKIIRARSKFFHGETQFLLYTERFHFFRRLFIRGIKRIIFYQPPSFPHFYSELCNFMQDTQEGTEGVKMSIDILYTKFDVLQLAGIIGTERATRIIASEKNVHMFMTERSKS